MPWPSLDQNERWVDWSWYQNDGTTQHKPFDVDVFCRNHPEVDGAIIRAVWPDGSTDQHYEHYYDGFLRNGKKVGAYLWPNPQKTIANMLKDWNTALSGRLPKLLAYDWEEASTFLGKSNAQLTSLMQSLWAALPGFYGEQTHIFYSRGSWLDSRITVGEWFHSIKFWLANYIYPDDNPPLMATHWSEIDKFLPIDNGFTPRRGPVKVENVVGWQFSSFGKIVPNGTSDMDYFLKSFVGPIYGEPVPVPSPKVPIEIRASLDKVDIRIVDNGP